MSMVECSHESISFDQTENDSEIAIINQCLDEIEERMQNGQSYLSDRYASQDVIDEIEKLRLYHETRKEILLKRLEALGQVRSDVFESRTAIR